MTTTISAAAKSEIPVVRDADIEQQSQLGLDASTREKIQAVVHKVFLGQEVPGLTRFSSRYDIFRVKDIPGYVIKIDHDKQGKGFAERIKEMVAARKTCLQLGLKRLVIPKATTIEVVGHSDGPLKILVEEELSFAQSASVQERLFHTPGKSLEKAIRQLAIFICKSRYVDVDYRNNPILESKDGKVRIGLIDLEPTPFSDGIIGANVRGWPRGLVNCVSEELVPSVVEEVNKHREEKLSDETVAGARNLWKAYRIKNIRDGREPVSGEKVDFSSYDCFSVEQKKQLKACAELMIKTINGMLQRAPEEYTIRDKRYITLPFSDRLVRDYDGDAKFGQGILKTIFRGCSTYLEVVHKKLFFEGIAHEFRPIRNGYGFSFQV